MTGAEERDPELEALRTRRIEQLLARRPGPAVALGPEPGPTELTSASIASFLAEHRRVVVDVWAPWCGPCRTMAPVLEALARELAPRVRFGKLNADHEPALAARWNVEGIPTLLLFARGTRVDRVVGAYPHDVLAARLRRVYRIDAESSRTEDGPE